MSIALRLVALAAFASALPASAAERSFPVQGFDRIINETSVDLTVAVGPTFRAVAQGDPSLLDRLVLTVSDGVLRIAARPDARGRGAMRIALPALSGIVVSASGDAEIDRVTAPQFTGRTTGSGNLFIARLESPRASLQATGSGDIRAVGHTEMLSAGSTGSGDLDLSALDAASLDASSTGSGDILARARVEARLRSTGSGDVLLTGTARCQVKSTGSGSVRCGD